jgi:hypothetical protein
VTIELKRYLCELPVKLEPEHRDSPVTLGDCYHHQVLAALGAPCNLGLVILGENLKPPDNIQWERGDASQSPDCAIVLGLAVTLLGNLERDECSGAKSFRPIGNTAATLSDIGEGI